MEKNNANKRQNEANGNGSCNTGQKQAKKPGTFTKNDPRINRNGRPKSFDQCRTLAQEIAHAVKENGLSTVETILQRWADSKDFIEANRFLEIAYGKVPDKIETTIDDKRTLHLHWPHERPDLATANGNGNERN